MAKVIYENNNGEQRVIMENIPDYIFPEAVIINRTDYFATKLWTEDDIKGEMEQMGYEPTDEDVAEVINAGGKWRDLTSCFDFEWEAIRQVITEVMGRKEMVA